MSSSDPHRQDLDQLRRQAKEPRHAARGGERTAVQRIIRQALRGRGAPAPVTVAQLVIAGEFGFASWPKLKAVVESRAGLGRRITYQNPDVVDAGDGRVMPAFPEGRALRSAAGACRPGPSRVGRRSA
jgi:hypothetical protein